MLGREGRFRRGISVPAGVVCASERIVIGRSGSEAQQPAGAPRRQAPGTVPRNRLLSQRLAQTGLGRRARPRPPAGIRHKRAHPGAGRPRSTPGPGLSSPYPVAGLRRAQWRPGGPSWRPSGREARRPPTGRAAWRPSCPRRPAAALPRGLNVGAWIARLQTREYTLQAIGWVRVVSGAQSLLSVYLLAMWALTYFGRPFQ
jgi:hypothetical protein